MRIHSILAYGEEGLDDRVPKNEIVIYDVEILNVRRAVVERKGIRMNELLEFRDTNKVNDCGMKVQGR